MPITRETFQTIIPGDQDDVAEESPYMLDADEGAKNAGQSANINTGAIQSTVEFQDDSSSSNTGDMGAKENTQEARIEGPDNLPTADPTSAEKEEAFGAAHLQRETRRSVANGRDVPQFTPRSRERESMEFNWDEARAQAGIYERRARTQRDAATEHLGRIHDIVELLIDMSEAHSNDGERKLQSLESKVAEMETRLAVNR